MIEDNEVTLKIKRMDIAAAIVIAAMQTNTKGPAVKAATDLLTEELKVRGDDTPTNAAEK